MKTRFFRTVWRINAVLICLAAVLIIFVCAFASYFIIQETRRSSALPNAVKIDEPVQRSKQKRTISRTDQLAGTTIVRCFLNSESDYRGGSFSKGSDSATRNLFYYDLSSGAGHWILPNNRSVILDEDDYRYPLDKPMVRWTSITVVDSDTNHDGGLSSADLQSFSVSKADGLSYTAVITGIEAVMKASLVSEFQLIVFYRKNGNTLVSMVDLNKMKVISEQNIFEKPNS